MSHVYAFIDGASFDITIESFLRDFDFKFEDIDWNQITKNAARIFYFDSLPVKRDDETNAVYQAKFDAKNLKFAKLRRVPNMHVREGVSRYRKSSDLPALSQKGVDVSLAVEVMRHASLGNMECARIFACDLDFYPLLDALTNTKVKTELYYRRRGTSDELIGAADISFELNHYSFHPALTALKKIEYTLASFDHNGKVLNKIRDGSTRHGNVTLNTEIESGKFVIFGALEGDGEYFVESKSEGLVQGHFEACAGDRITWQSGSKTLEKDRQ